MINHLDDEINNFIATYIISLTAWDLLNYFYQNSKFGYTSDLLACSINHDKEDVKEALKVFVDAGEIRLFESKYYYQPTAEFKKNMAVLIKMAENFETRRSILVSILKHSINQRII